MAAIVSNNRWVREPGDFAVRLGEKDLSGLFSKKIVIEEGTTGLLMILGRYDRRLETGEHQLEGGLGALLAGKDRKQLVLVSLGEAKLDVSLARVLSRDPVPFSVRCNLALRFAPGREAVFLSNFMSGVDYLGTNELRGLIYPELNEGAQDWASRHTVRELAENLSLRDELALSLESHMRPVLDRYGLSFGRVELKEFRCEIWDRSVNMRVQTSLQVTEEQAQLEGRKRLFDIAVEKDIQEIAEETEKVATYEKRILVWQRIQRAANQEQMNKIRSEQDLLDFIRQTDRERVLKEDEFERFKAELRQAGDDRERLHTHLVRMAQMEEEYDFRRKELSQQTALSRERLEGELGLERLRLESQLEGELKRADLTLERERRQGQHARNEEALAAANRWERELQEAKTDAQVRGLGRESARLDGELALALDERRAAQQRLNQQEQVRIDLDRRAREQEISLMAQQAEVDLRLRELRERHQQELESMRTMDAMSLHTLIAVSEGSKAPLLAELARTEALKSMSPEQILAMAAEKSPELGGAFAEMATKGDSAQVKEWYERLLSEQKESSGQLRQTQREMTETMKELFNKALETQAQVSQAFAYGGGQLRQPQAPQAAQPAPQPQRMVVCRRCLQESQTGTKFCPNCGDSLMAEPR